MLQFPKLYDLNWWAEELHLGHFTIADLNAMPRNEIEQLFLTVRDAAYAHINHEQTLPSRPFPEKHPYKGQSILNAGTTIYLIGTFPPVSHIVDDEAIEVNPHYPGGGLVAPPQIPYYHGNRSSLWSLLNIDLPENRFAAKDAIINHLSNKPVNYFDIIDWCQRKDQSYSSEDTALCNIVANADGLNHVLNAATTPTLIFNSSSTSYLGGIRFSAGGTFKPRIASFDLFLDTLLRLGHSAQLSFEQEPALWWDFHNQMHHAAIRTQSIYKLIFWLRVDSRQMLVIAAPSPAARNLTLNTSFQNFVQLFAGGDRESYKRYVYQNACDANYQLLWDLIA